uniref:Kazal-like domain-containing protein n=1 Tax=Heliothis virescens TaxID=7102 RepID=A0A2A4K3F9_HELVI
MILAVTTCTNLAHVETVGNNHPKAIVKREAEKGDNSVDNFHQFIEEKLMHQNQALEHLIVEVDKSGNLIKKLIDNLSRGLEKPNLPTKAAPAEVPPNTNEQSNSNEGVDNFIARLGKNLPKYGNLAKHLLVKDVYYGTDPTPIIEQFTDGPLLQSGSRRSYGDDPTVSPNPDGDDTKINPWCPMALLCQKSVDPICGFDDKFGYGKFEDLCHLLRMEQTLGSLPRPTPFEQGHMRIINDHWCWRARICHNMAGQPVCGVDLRRKQKRMFQNPCTLSKHNCDQMHALLLLSRARAREQSKASYERDDTVLAEREAQFFCYKDKSCTPGGPKVCGYDPHQPWLALFADLCTLYKANCARKGRFKLVEQVVCDTKMEYDKEHVNEEFEWSHVAPITTTTTESTTIDETEYLRHIKVKLVL